MLIECMAEALTGGEYQAGEDRDEVDLEEFKRLYGDNRTVSR